MFYYSFSYAIWIVLALEAISLGIWWSYLWCQNADHRNSDLLFNTYHSCIYSWKVRKKRSKVQVNLCQKHLFLDQLTHNMTKDCSLIYQFSTWKLQAQNMLCTQIVFLFLFWHSEQFLHTKCSPHVLSLLFPCTELVNQSTNVCHIVG